MTTEHGSYYVPEHSVWPIIGAIGLLFFALGSLNFESTWGSVSFVTGLLILIVMLCGWFGAVIRESRAGLYDAQMDRTFRWGMFWFIVSEIAFFSTLLGALLYVRMSTLPWLAGTGEGGSLLTHYLLWPTFQFSWPLSQTPSPGFPPVYQIPEAWGIPLLNTLTLLISAIFGTLALWGLKENRNLLTRLALSITVLLGISFIGIQIHYCLLVIQHYNLTITSGIYGSLFFALVGFHTLHILIGLLFLLIILWRSLCNHFTDPQSHFGFEAAIWFWSFLSIVWLFTFIFLYAF